MEERCEDAETYGVRPSTREDVSSGTLGKRWKAGVIRG